MDRPFLPASRIGRWAFWLGLAAAAWGVLFPSLPGIVGPLLEGAGPRPIRIPMGFSGALLELALAVAAIATGVVALRRGERAWPMILAFGVAVLIGGFWILFALGEVLVPH